MHSFWGIDVIFPVSAPLQVPACIEHTIAPFLLGERTAVAQESFLRNHIDADTANWRIRPSEVAIYQLLA
ncbi:hypothetical protein D3C84_1153750 [compost metagenome]